MASLSNQTSVEPAPILLANRVAEEKAEVTDLGCRRAAAPRGDDYGATKGWVVSPTP